MRVWKNREVPLHFKGLSTRDETMEEPRGTTTVRETKVQKKLDVPLHFKGLRKRDETMEEP